LFGGKDEARDFVMEKFFIEANINYFKRVKKIGRVLSLI